VPKLFAAAREALGDDVHLLHDSHHRLTPIEAARLGKDLEPYRPFWMEDVTPPRTRPASATSAAHDDAPRGGRGVQPIWDCKQLIEEQLIDYIRTTIVHAGGISHLKRIAHLAEINNVKHRLPRRYRPVAGLHGRGPALRPVGPELRHAGIYASHAETDRRIPARLQLQGRRPAPRRSAWAWRRHRRGFGRPIPLRPASLPVNRLEDGTLFNW
jgi:mannonate dehydratase